MKNKKYLLLALIFALVFAIHYSSDVSTSFDSRWSIHVAASLLNEGNINLDEYSSMLKIGNEYSIETVNGHKYTIFPYGSSILAVPFVYLADKLMPLFGDMDVQGILYAREHAKLELFIASIITALTACIIFSIARLYLGIWLSLLTTFIFALCSSSWTTASRALWSHGPSMLMLSAALYLILQSKKNPKLIQYASIPLAFSFVIRPTNSISIILLSLFVLISYRRYFIKYILWCLPVSVPFFAFNLYSFNNILSTYYFPTRLSSNASLFREALLGNLISPSRGLFVFSVIFLFSIYGIYRLIITRKFEFIHCSLCLIIALHLVAVSKLPKWWGGHSYGPRFFSDMIPYLVFFLIPAVEYLFNTKNNKIRIRIFRILFVSCIVLSFLIHFRGANYWAVYQWNVEPINIDRKPSRLWDWKDPQFLRGLNRDHPFIQYSCFNIYPFLINKQTVTNMPAITADKISIQKKEGTPWNADGTIRIPKKGIEIQLETKHTEKYLLLSLDHDDEYSIVFCLEDKVVAKRYRHCKLLEGGGLRHYTIIIPGKAQRYGYNSVRLIPARGDGRYSIGYLGFEN